MIAVCGNCKAKLQLELPAEFKGKMVKFKCTKCGKMNQVDLSQVRSSEIPMPPVPTPMPDIPLKPKPDQKQMEPGWLVVHDENAPVQTFALKTGKNTVGRVSQQKPSDIMIETKDTYMSRCHFTLDVQKTARGNFEYLISDNKSANGTFLNADKNKRLNENDQIYINDGDTIQAGRTKIVLKTGAVAGNKQQAEKTVVQTDYSKTIIL